MDTDLLREIGGGIVKTALAFPFMLLGIWALFDLLDYLVMVGVVETTASFIVIVVELVIVVLILGVWGKKESEEN